MTSGGWEVAAVGHTGAVTAFPALEPAPTGRPRLGLEVLIVLAISLGQSGVYSVLRIIERMTRGVVGRSVSQVETGVAAERSARESADTELNTKVSTLNTEMSTVKSDVETMKTDVAALRSDLTALRDEFGAKITAMENGMTFAFPVNFAFDDAAVREEDRASLDRFAQVVGKHYAGAVVTVEGHADPAGSRAYNRELSKRRAVIETKKGGICSLCGKVRVGDA